MMSYSKLAANVFVVRKETKGFDLLIMRSGAEFLYMMRTRWNNAGLQVEFVM